jgi:hypothetical protein
VCFRNTVAKYWLELNPHSIAISVMEAFALLTIISRALAAKIKEERISRKAAKAQRNQARYRKTSLQSSDARFSAMVLRKSR